MGFAKILNKLSDKLDNMSENVSGNMAVTDIKKRSLRRLYPNQIEQLAREHNISIPKSRKQRFYILIERCSKLSGPEIFDFSERHRVTGTYELRNEYESIIEKRDEVNNKLWGKEQKEKTESKHSELFNEVVEEIKAFKTKVVAQHEQPYQFLLFGWLQQKFPDLKIEEQRGSSRPDIIIKDIAIEVKGPTEHKDLQTIADKLIRYNQHFKGGTIAVLFNVKVNERMYSEWRKGLEALHPDVVIFRK